MNKTTLRLGGLSRAGWSSVLMGLGFVALHFALVGLSMDFGQKGQPAPRSLLTLVGIELAAGTLFCLMIRHGRNALETRGLLSWVVALGVLVRVIVLTSTPMLEDDYYRYLWDGAVTASGMNPYALAPIEVLESTESVSPALRKLAVQSGTVLPLVNHPHLRSVYPPVAQAAFALAYGLRPWTLLAWRLVLFMSDLITLALVVGLLKLLKLPSLWSVIYWWNPILIKETYNSAHMDTIVLPFVLGAVMLTIRRKYLWAAGVLALATGVKLWPVMLLPVVARPVLADPKKLIASLCLFALLAGAIFFPVYSAGFGRRSGFVAYGGSWEMNDALFMAVLWVVRALLKAIPPFSSHGHVITRILVVTLLAAWIAWLSRRDAREPSEICERCLLILAGIFLLSPTQFPWYYVWLLPFLALRPRPSLVLLTALLPLYYLRFYFAAINRVGIFDFGIVWLEYVPVWFLLYREWTLERYPTAGLELAA